MSQDSLDTLDAIKEAANNSTGYPYFFSPGANQFFNAGFEEEVYPFAFLPGTIFITSEQDDARTDPRDRVRGWTIRYAYFDEDGDFQMDKLSEVQGVESAEEAHGFARAAVTARTLDEVQEIWRRMLDEDDEDDEPLRVLLGQLRLVVTERKISRTAEDPRFWTARIETAIPGSWERLSTASEDIDFEGPHDVDLAGEYDEPKELLWGRGRRLKTLPAGLNDAWKAALESRDQGAVKAQRIRTQEQLRGVLNEIDFTDHEPDEVNVSAHFEVRGVRLDNAGHWPQRPDLPFPEAITELHVVLKKDGRPVAVVNVSDMLGWLQEDRA